MFHIGPVISGTLRKQDLIPTLLEELAKLSPAAHQQVCDPGAGFSVFPQYAREDEDAQWWDSEDAQCLLANLFDALQELAPPFVDFDAHEGDGSCFGWWPRVESVMRAVREGDVTQVSDPNEVDRIPGFAVFVNDHGNVTLYDGGEVVWATV